MNLTSVTLIVCCCAVTYCIGARLKESDLLNRSNQLSHKPRQSDLAEEASYKKDAYDIAENDIQGTSDKNLIVESRQKKKKEKGMMSKIMPMMWIPFMLQSAMIPMAITSLKFMLLKSMIIGKIAILLMIINALRKSNNDGGVFSHNIHVQHHEKQLSKAHYGYSGEEEEYGAYVNKRSSR